MNNYTTNDLYVASGTRGTWIKVPGSSKLIVNDSIGEKDNCANLGKVGLFDIGGI
jgi:hypothetical protein